MSLKNAIISIVDRLKSIPATTYDAFSSELFKNVAIWNDQIAQSFGESGTNYNLLSPSAFVEVNTDNSDFLGIGFTSCDLNVDIHIVNVQLDAIDGTLDQDLEVFNLRDNTKIWLNLFTPTNCNDLMYVTERQDFAHDNVYHYIISFKTRFTDSAGANIPHQYDGTVSLMYNFDWIGPTSSPYPQNILCEIPSGLTSTNNGNTTVINWNIPSNPPAEYEYYTVDLINNIVKPRQLINADNGVLTLNDLDLSDYIIYVRRFCGGNDFTPYVSLTFSSSPFVCEIPILTGVTDITDTSANVNWLIPLELPANYRYNLQLNGATVSENVGVSGDSGSLELTGLTPTGQYEIFIRRNCGSGVLSDFVSEVFATLSPG